MLFKELFGERLAGILHSINDEVGDRTLATAGRSSLVYGKEKIVENLLDKALNEHQHKMMLAQAKRYLHAS